MKNSLVVIVALEEELNPDNIFSHIPVIYSGIGKVNASIATFRAIKEYNPNLIINFGTVGKITPNLSGLIQIGSVIQRDMIAEPLAPRGSVPFSIRPNKFVSISNGHICGTGDSFVTQRDDWLIQNGVDVVDMELFAIASVAHEHKIDWISYKFISDDANESSDQKWAKQVNQGQKLFVERLHAYLVRQNL
ncbi:MAG: 5'-methylthioadenosine/S-adenosylhomocysteine nucleosidase [Nitrosospira sp.]|nr:5'-methylthioadenosine/S-adenosylhomocysteine nucleosidase [Nitrosospira sp.]MBI0407597.1 5'-methylthioadenosine/S-adenosylhomocysteine nucleosidase [Nitrosospira sp.]MBI0414337.1 5'-methylthioadenosine/S-adenosylhomocysteine nucleosidase [Nitrosospira sp.]MBI0415413.1 5'-methylthioadenosine/S-adenosylhomocysteine nucleosidase [Nitrosospira sp.]MBI0417032.1 5'-methylthioadenosine/S-adenosylhomocysteine nucleosidase [Nitrosospira sp.]